MGMMCILCVKDVSSGVIILLLNSRILLLNNAASCAVNGLFRFRSFNGLLFMNET